MSISSYRDLEVWQLGIRLSLGVYKLTSSFPDNERFGLTSQMRRCAVSVPSNIAEGHARLSTREYIRHLSIALGSLAEFETQLYIVAQLSLDRDDAANELFEIADHIGRKIRNLIKSLEAKLANSP